MNQLSLFDAPLRQTLPPATAPHVKPSGRPEVAYRNPDQPAQAWTGRGKPPRWITEWVQSGKSLDALRVAGARP